MDFKFLVYLLLALAFFTTVSLVAMKALDKIEERRQRRFKQKVDRYRRGHH
jgi:type II secretory pathway component PulJ